MIQLLIIYFFPGLVMGNNIWGGGEAGRFLAAAVAFIFNYACYFSEIYRGGIQGVPHGQEEAGLVLGMRYVSCPHYCASGNYMGRTGISERIAGNCRSHLAALFYSGILSDL